MKNLIAGLMLSTALVCGAEAQQGYVPTNWDQSEACRIARGEMSPPMMARQLADMHRAGAQAHCDTLKRVEADKKRRHEEQQAAAAAQRQAKAEQERQREELRAAEAVKRQEEFDRERKLAEERFAAEAVRRQAERASGRNASGGI